MQVGSITPLILTFNEEANLERTLQKLRWAQEVVVVDSGSSDRTREIATACSNVRFLVRAFDDHTSQWNYGVEQAATDWILALDADYVLGEGFEKELAGLPAEAGVDAYFAGFRYLVFGKPLCGSLYPPRAVLFRRSQCRYVQDGHTQVLHIPGRSEMLRSKIDHDDRKSLTAWLTAQDKYALLEADKLLGKVAAQLRIQDRLRKTMFAAVPISLFYTLFVAGTVRDGWRGWYYALQRMLAEMLLALRLMEKRFQGASPSPKKGSN